jgi:small subunit ribosomal protein S6
MKHYELLFVVKPTLTEEETTSKLESVKGILEKNSATIKSVDDMGVRKLAYEIQKYQRGHYYVIYFQAEPSSMDEIIRNLRYDEDIIRFLNVKYENKKEIAQWEKLSSSVGKKDKKSESPKSEESSSDEAPKEE